MIRKYIQLGLVIASLLCITKVGNTQCVGESGTVKWSYWQNFYGSSTTGLFSYEGFPDRPDGSRMLTTISSPVNFGSNYGSFIRGYISTPTSGTATFNITGDDDTQVYLSTDESPANLSLLCSVPNWTNRDEHNKYPEQTSAVINMVAGQYYYFEIFHIEGGGGDHLQLHWQTSWLNNVNWAIIGGANVNAYACENDCPERGTPCDDGNAATEDDVEDGYCNCIGEAPAPTSCIGERYITQAYYYDSISGSYLSDLYENPNWPLIPNREENLRGIYGPLETGSTNVYGSFLQGYITVPVTGDYDFNITSDNSSVFYLSSDHTEANKRADSIYVRGSTGYDQHDRYDNQTMLNVRLEKGKYYYYEVQHKENTYRDFFSVFWKADWYGSNYWRQIPNFYLYDYGCDAPCIAEGTPCDDGDIFTDNDAYNEFCECSGTPCATGDCDNPEANFVATPGCATTDNLDIRPETSWMSCTSRPNPNAARGSGHWIQYDLGENYRVNNSKVWNYNAPGMTDRGFRNVVVDYSTNGTTWQQLGTFNWGEAPGVVDYSGFTGPNFDNVAVRYILITGLDSYGTSGCSGFSKILFNAVKCGPVGTPCDDGDPFTSNDAMDANCNCVGQDLAINDCAEDMLDLGHATLPEDNYSATNEVMSGNTLAGTKAFSFVAGESIVIMPGFTIGGNAELEAHIEDCVSNLVSDEIQRALKARKKKKAEKSKLPALLMLDMPSPAEEKQQEEIRKSYREVIYRLDQPSSVSMELVNKKGEVVMTIVNRYHENRGTYKKYIPKARLQEEGLSVRVRINQQVVETPISAEPEIVEEESGAQE